MSDYIDTINRQEAIDAFNEQNWKLSDIPSYPICKEIRKAAQDTIRSLPSEQPVITFEDVKKYCEKRHLVILTMEFYDEMKRTLQSAQPERIKGRWVKMSDADGTYYCCSECGAVMLDTRKKGNKMRTFEIYFSNLNEDTQKRLLEAVGAESASDMNWDIDICPIAMYDFEEPNNDCSDCQEFDCHECFKHKEESK